MRIISGKYRGKKLFTPAGKEVRPTAERAREALFSILYSRLGSLAECRVLDVFAGTGAFGLEALSRGAKNVTFIDKDIRLLTKNTALFKAENDKIKVISASVEKLPAAQEKYNILFMDAPYAQGLSELAMQRLIDGDWLEPNALCLVETRCDENFVGGENLCLLDERIYGIAKIRIYAYKK